jgi:hypothetical protein
MSFRIAAAVVASLTLSAAMTGTAAAQPLSHPRAPQVTGSQLASALLPASAWGTTFSAISTLSTGKRLYSTKVTSTVGRMSCGYYENNIFTSGFGNTAGAGSNFTNTDPRLTYPESILGGSQDVLQFTASGPAATYFGQAQAKYAGCGSFSFADGDTNPGGGAISVSTLSVSATRISGDRAFVAIEQASESARPGQLLYYNVLFALAGTNVYELAEGSGINDPPSSALMSELIRHVQALYRHS